MTSQVHSIRSLIAQVSGLIGLLVFLNQAWGYEPLDRTILTAIGAGLATYVVLVLGYATVQRILAYTPPEEADAPAPNDEAAADDDAQRASDDAASKTASAPAAATAGASTATDTAAA